MARLHAAAGTPTLELEDAEVELLRGLLGEVADELSEDATAGPVRERLLPDAHRDDPELAAAVRDLIEDSLREDKLADIAAVLAALPLGAGAVELTEPDPWLRALNDVRLMLGVELGVTEDTDPPEAVQDRTQLRLAIYFWLTHLQEGMVASAVR